MATNAAGIDASLGQHYKLFAKENALIELSRQTVTLRRQRPPPSRASCKFQLQPHVMKAAAAAAATATRRKIFAYLLLFFRSVVQLISAQCAPVAHFRIHLQWGKVNMAWRLCVEEERSCNLLNK